MPAGNDATKVNTFVVNGRTVDIHITKHGSDWYWAAMSVMGTSMLTIIGLSLFRPRTKRIFHYILATAALVAMIEHYSMASNLGWVPIDVEWRRPRDPLVAGINRQIWWVRYCCWFIIWPLLALAVLLTAAMPVTNIIWTSFLTCVTAVMALVGAMVRTDYKWGYYGFWIGCWLGLGYYMVWAPHRYASALGRDVRRAFIVSAGWIWFLWGVYPVCWGISEGGNVISPDSEFIFYGVLDSCLIPMTSAFLLWSHRDIDPLRLGIATRDYDDPMPHNWPASYHEKDHGMVVGTATNGTTTGATNADQATTTAV